MNLLLINYEYPPVGGGAATATQAMARALAALGHTPHVLTAAYRELRGTTVEGSVLVHRIPARRSQAEACSVFEMAVFGAAALQAVRPLARRHRIDGVIAFFSLPCAPVAYWSGCPYVVSLRGGDVPGTEPSLAAVHRMLTPLRRHLLRSARAVVANSDGLRRLAESADPVPVRIIPNGVDTDLFRPAPVAGPRVGPLRLLFVGRFQQQKNLSWLLRRLANPSLPPFRLTLVGDGPLHASLRTEAGALGLANRIEWPGWLPRDRLTGCYQEHDVLLNLSLYEGMPNVVLEAMACGLPVVASRVAGNDALVRDGENGHLIPLDDDLALTAALTRLADPATREEFGRQARITAQTYSWSAVARAYAGLLGAA